MFKRNDNRAVLHLRIETVTPLLIRAGDAGLDPTIADLACVRTNHARHGRTVYIPGSSLKGVIRSAAEASVRGLSLGGLEGACDPLDHSASCGGRNNDKKEGPTAAMHKAHCLACRTFGSTRMKGRASVRDLFPFRDDGPDEENRRRANAVEARHGVAINRISGAVQHGPFDLETVPPGVSFYGEVALENYQTWQLGLLAAAFDELNDGFAQLGSTKSRGLGVVKASVREILHEQSVGRKGPAEVADMLPQREVERYGLLRAQPLPDSQPMPWGLRARFTIAEPQTASWLAAGRDALEELVRGGAQ